MLTDFINEHTPRLSPHSDADTQPTQGFQRVIQRAILHVQSSGKKEVTGANVLVAIFGEKESHAVYFLNQRGVTRLDVVNYIAHGITKTSAKKDEKQESAKEEADGEQQPAGALDAYTVNLNQLAKTGKIDPLIGREVELERVIQVLCRRRKNNPLLVGEAGVGKTAIAEGLARRVSPTIRSRSCSSTRSTPLSAPARRPAARLTHRTCSSPRSTPARSNASARPPTTSTG